MVEGNRYLWNCLKYIDLNMVRAGAVKHPREWEWCGYHELVGARSRYCLIDRGRLLEALGDEWNPAAFPLKYAECIDEACQRAQRSREAMWTESLAVGSERYVRSVAATLKNRHQIEVGEQETGGGGWFLRETKADYS